MAQQKKPEAQQKKLENGDHEEKIPQHLRDRIDLYVMRSIIRALALFGIANFAVALGGIAYILFYLPERVIGDMQPRLDRAVDDSVAEFEQEARTKIDAAVQDATERIENLEINIGKEYSEISGFYFQKSADALVEAGRAYDKASIASERANAAYETVLRVESTLADGRDLSAQSSSQMPGATSTNLLALTQRVDEIEEALETQGEAGVVKFGDRIRLQSAEGLFLWARGGDRAEKQVVLSGPPREPWTIRPE